MNITLKGLLSSFTKSIDIYNYLLKNHHRRTAISAYNLGLRFGLDSDSLSNLVIAASLHDIGALTVAERDDLIKMDVDNPYPHSNLGSYMLDSFPLFNKVEKIIYYHHWHYCNDAYFDSRKGEVPIESYILHLADRIEILIDKEIPVLMQKDFIRRTISSKNNTIFHPKVVDVFLLESANDSFWLDIDNLDMDQIMDLGLSPKYEMQIDLDMLDDFSFTLSKIIDSRSKFAISHSFGVSQVSYVIGKLMNYPESTCRKLKIAGLLHDMGKIAIPTEIIEKKGFLNESERTNIRTHAYFTSLILQNVQGLEEIITWASSHHETHDGLGYPFKLSKNNITPEMDIIAYADIFTALSEERPYRKGMSPEEIIFLLESDFKSKHGDYVFKYIKNNFYYIYNICILSVNEGIQRFKTFEENKSIDESRYLK